MNRRDLLKKSAVAGGAVMWATPVIQTLGQGTAHAAGSPPCEGCMRIQELSAGNTPGTPAINVNSQISINCNDGAGCDVSVYTYLWSVVSSTNCYFDVAAANAGTGSSVLNGNLGTFPTPQTCPGAAGQARVSLTYTHRCVNTNNPGQGTSYTCTRIEDVFWRSCNAVGGPSSTLISTTCPAPTTDCP